MGISEDDLLDRLRQGYEAFNRGDYDAATEWVHPDRVTRMETYLEHEEMRRAAPSAGTDVLPT